MEPSPSPETISTAYPATSPTSEDTASTLINALEAVYEYLDDPA
jgi:hypothetical protein